ncbi:DUF4124 domain-containing protein [Luteimonas vadosa]|uniref:DUF4124 domain-containing protein n=1 Tax=Luteimonas vadosa TaxID=1165507 RepID=A0ABP9DR48_9GAMM
MHRFVLLPALGCLCLAMSVAHAQETAREVYQWKDAKGVTHYSQTPPAKGSYQQRSIRQTGVAAPTTTAAAEAATAVENPQCVVAKRNIAALDSDRPVGQDADGDGQPDTTMTDAQRASQRTLAEAAVKAYCTTP